MSGGWKEFCALADAERWDEAEALARRDETIFRGNPYALVRVAGVLQLGSGEGPYSLEDVEAMYKEAIEADETYADAWVELGWFYLNVVDDAAKALPLFEKARELFRRAAAKAVVGIADCKTELGSPNQALTWLQANQHLDLDQKTLDKGRDWIRKFL